MPSDELVPLALRALEGAIAEFRAIVEGALAQSERYLEVMEADPDADMERAAAELGPFAQGRLDMEGFASLVRRSPAIPALHLARFRTAVDVMREVLGERGDLHATRVPSAGSLTRTVDQALARVGRAFGAVKAVDLMRSGGFHHDVHEELLSRLEFRTWSRTERRYAPPLVVEVDGADLQVGGLSDFADGRQRIVLVVHGPCPPATLVRLITPGTLVLQTDGERGLDVLAGFDGPGIAAIVPAEAARFLHDPRGGRESWQRLSVWHVPEGPPRRSVGGISPWQMSEDLRQLAALAAAPSEPALPGGRSAATSPADAVDQLADWLLRQADLKGTG